MESERGTCLIACLTAPSVRSIESFSHGLSLVQKPGNVAGEGRAGRGGGGERDKCSRGRVGWFSVEDKDNFIDSFSILEMHLSTR